MSARKRRVALSAALRRQHVEAFEQRLRDTLRQALRAWDEEHGDEDRQGLTTHPAIEAACTLVGSRSLGVDLVRILAGEAPATARDTRAAVNAVLRSKRRQLGRALTGNDWLPTHRISLLACAWWGGIDVWSAGAPGRAQRPKRFWSQSENQIAAIQTFAATHPGLPITAGNLGRHGFSALARALRGDALAALCAEARCSRRLARRSNGWWTAERVINRYAAFCYETGITLSAHALVLMGGEASSLRIYARRHFGRFRAFQEAVCARHPAIRRPARPTATDGTLLDSWSEVVVYHALRRALPAVPITTHVRLANDGRRSTDLVLDGRVHVEVLGMSDAETAAPRSKRQRKYARNWHAKQACYAALGIAPVVVAPADVHDKARLAARIAAMAALLGQAPVFTDITPIRSMRAKGAWTEETLCAAVAETAGDSGRFPTQAALHAGGHSHATNLLRRPGVRNRIAAKLGLADPHARHQWSAQRVVEEIAAIFDATGCFPSTAQLRRDGYGTLASARGRYWDGRNAELREAVASLSGRPVRSRTARGSLATLPQIAAALRPLAQRLGRMPTDKECKAAVLSTAWTRGSKQFGVRAVADAIGVPTAGGIRRTREECVACLAEIPGTLTLAIVQQHLGPEGVAIVRKLGGIKAVRAVRRGGSGHSG